jgi:hypothetical protein
VDIALFLEEIPQPVMLRLRFWADNHR